MTAERQGAAWTGAAAEAVDEREAASPRDEARDLIRVYLQPGQLYASGQPSAVTTVLGSCVAICLWDPVESVGGMNHYLLPFFAGNASQGSPRFGNVAVAQLVERLVALGAARGRLQAKVFGGACVLEAFQARQGHLGEKNAGVAFKLLEELGIPIVSRDVGGRSGRKLIFHTDLGTAWVARL
jgi:chemotaxis protein CheD